MSYIKYAQIFKALGDATRLEIIMLLKQKRTLCACEILQKFNITQPTLSYHMQMLLDCQIVNCLKVGKWNHYSVNIDTLNLCLNFINKGAI